MNNKISKMYKMINSSNLRVVLESILVGGIAGLIVSIYRLTLKYINVYTTLAYDFMRVHWFYIILGLVILMGIGYIVGYMVKKDSMISGSGIPQIEGILTGYFKSTSPLKILINKFIGGVLAIGSGLSLGIEGPSIQLGASFANFFGDITKRLKLEKRFLISSGAGAGLAAAFNAPFAGVMFVLEEVHKKFTPILFVSAIAASVTSDVVTWAFFGRKPILEVEGIIAIPFKYYLFLIALGIVVGVAGAFYNYVLIKTINLYEKIKVSLPIRMMIPFVVAMFFGLFLPEVLGGGNELINQILVNGVILKFAIILLIGKFVFSMISFASGTPGGILFPLLTLGALIGIIFGECSIQFLGVDEIYLINFILLAMAGMFASIVRAPITGLVLVCEMSGSFTEFGSIVLVCGVSYLVAELLKSDPVYESLFKLRLKSQNGNLKYENNSEIMIAYTVSMGSKITGRKLREINLPENALVVSIEREGDTIIPNGDTVIMAGDCINALVNESKEIILRKKLEQLCDLS